MSSSSERLSWLIQELHTGRIAHVSFSYNHSLKREKIKFILEDGYHCQGVYRPCLLGALSAARLACDSSISTDKGHRSSCKKKAVVEFWISQVPEGVEVEDESALVELLPPPHATPSPTDTDPKNGPLSAETIDLVGSWAKVQISLLPQSFRAASSSQDKNGVVTKMLQDIRSSTVTQTVRESLQSSFEEFIATSERKYAKTWSETEKHAMRQLVNNCFEFLWPDCVEKLLSGEDLGKMSSSLLSGSSSSGGSPKKKSQRTS